MRPKKIVLLVHGQDEDLRLLEYTISLWGYRVLTAATADDAREMLRGQFFVEAMVVPGLILNEPQKTLGNALIQQVQELSPETRSILVSKSSKELEHSRADAFLKRDARDFPRDLRLQLRILMARKRGPKRATVDLMLAKAASR